MSEPSEVDVIVVGMGPGGEAVAGSLAEKGLEVVGVDGRLVGGECPYYGCVPSKMVIRAANLLAEARRIPGMAGSATVEADFGVVAKRIRDEATDNWDDTAAVKRFTDKGGRFVRGWGRLEGEGLVAIGDEHFSARRGVVLNIGTDPDAPPIEGLSSTRYWSNRDALRATAAPSSLVVLGGGAIGVELAQAFARFGASVQLLESAPRILMAEEEAASAIVADALRRDGVTIRAGVNISSVHEEHGFHLELDRGETVHAERLLVATGRRADLSRAGVDAVGLDVDQAFIEVDDHLRAGTGLWAIGDVTGKGAFTHVSMYQSAIVIDDILGRPVTPADYRAVPRVTFSDPELGAVGLTEAEAHKQGRQVVCGSADVASSSRGWIHKAGNEGIIKLVADADEGVLIGATSVGPCGGEVLSFLALAVAQRVPIEAMRHLPYAYPTFHRAIESALADLDS